MHPEDSIYKVKTFINELQKVQDLYFNQLLDELSLNKLGQDYLFDYIFNCDDPRLDDFSHYLSDFKRNYDQMTSKDELKLDEFKTTNFDLDINHSGEFLDPSEQISYEIINSTTSSK